MIHTIPVSSRSATSRALAASALHTGAAEPERRVVGDADGVVDVAGPVDHGAGAEQLLVVGAHVGGDVGENRGLHERTGAGHDLAAGHHPGALVDRVRDLLDEAVAGLRRRQRSVVGVVGERVRRS